MRASVPQGAAVFNRAADVASIVAQIIGISGSLRRGSFNTSLLRAAAEYAPSGSSIVIASIHEVPLYDADRETSDGLPAAVRALKDRIAAADGLLVATPEYNNSIPGVLKNAIDWLSRPASDIRRVFGGRPVAMMGASAGRGGTGLAQAAWLPVLRTLGTNPWFGDRLQIASAGTVFGDEGQILDEAIRARLEAFVAGFVEFAGRARAQPRLSPPAAPTR